MHPDFEIVYIFTNPSYKEGLIKIGKTDKKDPKERARELYTTGVPTEFDVFFAATVEKHKNVESKIHNIFSEFRYNHQREFFIFCKFKVKEAILLSGAKEIDFSSYECDKEEEIVDNFNILEANVPVGSKLIFHKDHNFTCSVYNEYLVNYKGKLVSLSEAAKKTGLVKSDNINGPWFWMYENENLYNRMKKYNTYCPKA